MLHSTSHPPNLPNKYRIIVCRRAIGFWLGVRLAFILIAATAGGSAIVARGTISSLLVLRPTSLPIVIGATCFLVLLDWRVSGERLLLGNAGVSQEQVAATASVVVIVVEMLVFTASRFA